MTGFASRNGSLPPHSWGWELRSVNGKGLDLRIRVPEWIEGLETALRKVASAGIARGNVTLSLRVVREEDSGGIQVNTAQLDVVLAALHQIEQRAMDAGVSLAPSNATDIAVMRGVLEQALTEDDNDALKTALLAEFPSVLADFNAMRTSEGAALERVMREQLDEIDQLTAQCAALATARSDESATILKRNLARVLDNIDGVDENRIAQELALIAVKSDITEEIDRLQAHIAAGRDLLARIGPIGRKLDFLMQEFNREANTLCSKAQSTELTQTGLALKTVIDQMREQVQNVE